MSNVNLYIAHSLLNARRTHYSTAEIKKDSQGLSASAYCTMLRIPNVFGQFWVSDNRSWPSNRKRRIETVEWYTETRWLLAERIETTSENGVQWFIRYREAWLCSAASCVKKSNGGRGGKLKVKRQSIALSVAITELQSRTSPAARDHAVLPATRQNRFNSSESGPFTYRGKTKDWV